MKLSLAVYALTVGLMLRPAGVAPAAEVRLPGGVVMRITADTPQIFHIQIRRNGKFKPSILERYGIVKRKWPTVNIQQSSSGDLTRLKTTGAELVVNTKTGNLQLLDATGKVLLNRLAATPEATRAQGQAVYRRHQQWLAHYFRYNAREGANGIGGKIIGQPGTAGQPVKYIERYLTRWSIPHFGIRIYLNKSERLYGMGEASQKRVQLRGYAYRNWVEYRGLNGYDPKFAKFEQTEGGVPFVMSTRGWAVLMNTAWPTYFDLGAYRKNQAYVWGPFGRTDFYLMAGGGLRQNINLYTQISGRPILLPEWGYGLWFDGNILLNQFAMLEDGHNFHHLKFPVDCYSLEPGWMQKFYDFSHRANWNVNRFYLPKWLQGHGEKGTFIGAMRRMGIRMGLWFCCKDDLTLQAEREVAIRQGHPDTVPTRPYGWYHHLQKFVKEGIRAFKIDPSDIMMIHAGRKYYNGRRDLEMHNLTQVMILQQMYQGAAKGGPPSPRIFTQYCGVYTGTQHWGANTMDDDSIGPGTLCWMLNLGLTGNMNVATDMTPTQGPAAIQAAFFSGWTDVQSWASAGEPWFLDPRMQAIFRYYDDLRHRLIPYIYSTAWLGTRTGMPIMRAMPLIYPNDPQCANLTHEYMFGNAFLSVVFTDKAYLPQGDWIDYWTGRLYHGGQWITLHVPVDRGGGLFVRAGAIVPTWPTVQYVSRVPINNIGLSIWPHGKSEFTLYEDDGVTYQYLKGRFATTSITCVNNARSAKVTIGPASGMYGTHYAAGSLTPAGSLRSKSWGNMPRHRSFTLRVHMTKPTAVTVDGRPAAPGGKGWTYASATGRQATGILEIKVGRSTKANVPIYIDIQK